MYCISIKNQIFAFLIQFLAIICKFNPGLLAEGKFYFDFFQFKVEFFAFPESRFFQYDRNALVFYDVDQRNVSNLLNQKIEEFILFSQKHALREYEEMKFLDLMNDCF